MNNNDILRRLRYALDMDDAAVLDLFAAGGVHASPGLLHGWLKREDEPDMLPCSSRNFEAFLDALIVQRRGPPPLHLPPPNRVPFNANAVLKKLRIALVLKDVDILDILHQGGHPASKAELGGLFRPPGHKHYRDCGDQFLRAFLRGLTLRLRGTAPGQEPVEAGE